MSLTTSNVLAHPPRTPYAFSKDAIDPRLLKTLKKYGRVILGPNYKLKNIRKQFRQELIKQLSQYIFERDILNQDDLNVNLDKNDTIIQILKQIKRKIQERINR